jgi:nicotinate-nucleotide adenylyltransferase
MIIGVLGGSFCPPTIAHLELSKKCIEAGLCDKVIWVPVNDSYRKETNIESKYRVEMVKRTLANEPNIDYSLHELEHDRIVRTYESLQILQSRYPNDKLIFIAGADKMRFKWFQREEMVRDFGYIVTDRGDVHCSSAIRKSETLSKYKNNIRILKFDMPGSSTFAREDIQNVNHTDLVVPDVMQYITENHLFRR